MKVGILHLSDIHIEDSKDWILSKHKKIAQAVLGTWEELTTIFVVISGDIANKGFSEQYTLAHNFFTNIKEYIQKQSHAKVYFIVAPGNHDCDFSGVPYDSKARKSFIDTVVRNPSAIERGDSIYDGCLSVQKNFFDFIKNLDPQIEYPSKPEIFYQIEVNHDAQKFYFNIFNTAWLSQLNEDQGGLVFPNHLIKLDTEKLSSCAFSLSVFHHPENWLESNNAIEFKKLTEQNSDIILSGHEHYREAFYKRQTETEVETQIIKADALQERSRPTSSSFNLIIVDLACKKQKLFRFKWKDVEYTRFGKENEWQDFVRNRFLQKQSFFLSPDFENYINTLDSLPQHSRKRIVALEDFFISPRLYVTSLRDVIDGKNASKKIESDKFFEFISKHQKVLIYGETWQGKTTVAKMVFKKFYEKQYATLLIDGSKFEEATEDRFKKYLRNSFSTQYNVELWERFIQLPKEKRTLIIDNFGQSNLNQKSLQNLLQIANTYFQIVVVFSHNNLSLQQHLQNENGEVTFSDYAHCRMLPLDRTQRTKMIRRWVRFENEPTTQEAELVRQENQLINIIQTVVSNGLIEATPFYVIGVLQLIESYKSNPNAQFGSIGYIYEGIVTNKLSNIEKTAPQINQIFLVTSLIAHWLYKNNLSEISEDDLQEIIKDYNREYREDVYLPHFLRELENTQILFKLVSKNWKFVGSHLQDFFVAKYYAQAIGDDESNEQKQALIDVKLMIETLLYESHTRILLFLVYEANSNKKIIKWILQESRRVYSNFEIANFVTDVEFINNLEQSILDENLLESENPHKNRDNRDYLLSNEDDDEEIVNLESNKDQRLVKYSDDLDDFKKAAISLRMIELVGQLVKSFAGTIKADLKHELIEECIGIGLRFLRSVFDLHRNNVKEISEILKHLIRERHPRLSETELENRRDEIIILIHHALAYGVIKKISLSVGHEDLKDSFSDVFNSSELISYKVIETAIRLDHYNNPVADKLIKFGKSLNDNKFAQKILRRLIADYVNYFEVTGAERQKLVDAFKLSGGNSYLLNLNKGERNAIVSPKNSQRFMPPEK